ncbi:hypothetical protein V1478_005357 [Vespula squamosa]|uniref:Uncharacterized protein n=1 Tax=Vespula squamosa TaxID=30214 RepID=A0ABD2BDX0_VESSQ
MYMYFTVRATAHRGGSSVPRGSEAEGEGAGGGGKGGHREEEEEEEEEKEQKQQQQEEEDDKVPGHSERVTNQIIY